MAGISVSKSLVYAVAAPPNGIGVSKTAVFVVMIPFVLGVSVTKAVGYVVAIPAAAERVQCFIIG